MVMKSRQKSTLLLSPGCPTRRRQPYLASAFGKVCCPQRVCSVPWGTHEGRGGALHSDALHLIGSSKVRPFQSKLRVRL